MMTTNDVAQVFDTILSSPGMNEAVRIDTKISRKGILLLHQIIEAGLSEKGNEQGIQLSEFVSSETQEELKNMGIECLHKAGLVEMSEKLSRLGKPDKK